MLYHFLRKLYRDCSGVGFIELALTAPLLAVLFLGMVDLSVIVSTRIELEQAAQRTTDYALAKRPTSTDVSYLVTEAVNASGRPARDVRVQFILECDGVQGFGFNSNCVAGQLQKRFVSVEIDQPVQTGFNWRNMAAWFGGTRVPYEATTVTGDSIVRLQ